MIITLASSKGGVGKSMTTASLAGAFVHAGHNLSSDNLLSEGLEQTVGCLEIVAADDQ